MMAVRCGNENTPALMMMLLLSCCRIQAESERIKREASARLRESARQFAEAKKKELRDTLAAKELEVGPFGAVFVVDVRPRVRACVRVCVHVCVSIGAPRRRCYECAREQRMSKCVCVCATALLLCMLVL